MKQNNKDDPKALFPRQLSLHENFFWPAYRATRSPET